MKKKEALIFEHPELQKSKIRKNNEKLRQDAYKWMKQNKYSLQTTKKPGKYYMINTKNKHLTVNNYEEKEAVIGLYLKHRQ